ncbi:MAG: multicopper oxidase domain-containing protein [Candidatus Eremiobacteraeota bacterium]|nr:multicopper oxidase domain-containing protein [Candidatus Eremiobacteraeota bacterium]
MFASATTAATRARAVTTAAATAAPSAVLSDSFTGAASTPNVWSVYGDACLTAGGSTTPTTSIPACGANAPVDAAGSGALQLTTNGTNQLGTIISKVALSTARGFQVVFTDAAFNGTGADGMALFLTDATQALPTPTAALFGGKFGYLSLPGGYLGIGFDEYGNFSTIDGKGTTASGYPGPVPETVTIRGAEATSNQYIGGYTGTTSAAQSLPFALDSPTSTTRPANAPTMRVTLASNGFLTVEIDPHDGKGYRTAYNAAIVGVGGQPALPAQVYLGFGGGTGGKHQVHQISNLSVTPLAAPAMSFTPTQITNLAAWYDASDATTIAQTANAVSSWKDKSGNGLTLTQATTSRMPVTGQNIDGLGALSITNGQYLATSGTSFGAKVANESTTFVVTNATATTTSGTVVSAGAAPGTNTPRWQLRLYESGVTHFDFNNVSTGRIAANETYAGPATWTAAGSVSGKMQFLRKNGNTLVSSNGPAATVTNANPLVVGANFNGASVDYPYAGTVGEILVYNRMLTTAETQSVEGYMACKWGLQNRLPANHPYRSTCPGAVAAAPIPTPTPTGSALPIPPELRSANGQLALTVVAQADASGNPKLTYNGSPVPPTLRLLPGDVLSIQLTNSLPTPPAGSAYVNDTNLHFHGLHVSPNAPGDDSIDMLALPGQTLNYKFSIPTTHPPGLYWYHSHAHGEVERQNLSGMSGALVINGIAQYAPSVTNMPERILIVRDTVLAGQALPNADKRQIYAMGWAMQHAQGSHGIAMSGARGNMTMGKSIAVRSSDSRTSRNPYVVVDPNFRRFDRRRFDASDGHCVGTETAAKGWTVNGATQPTIGIRPGEQQLWRLVNAGSDSYLDVAVDNAQMQIVALDGVPLGSGINTPASMLVNDYVVPPASRVEFIVTGPPSGSAAYLRTKCFDAGASGVAMPATTLAVLDPTSSISDNARKRQRVSPKAIAYHFPRTSPRRTAAGAVRARATFATTPVARTQTLTYSDQNTINGESYDPGADPQFYAQSGTVEEWTIVNDSSQVHTFHIHQIHFVVEAINGVAQSAEYVMDNVNVPAASSTGPGSVKILLDFTDPAIIGTFLLHCHILSHEDAGMVAKIRVGTAPPLTTSSSSVTFTNAASPAQNVTIGGGKTPYTVSGCAGVANGTTSGATLSIAPTGAGSCVFTVEDATDENVSIGVTVDANAAAMTVAPTSLSFTSSAAAAQNASIAGGTAPYSVTGCTGVANAAINASENGLTVSPAAAGSCTLTVSDSASHTATLAVSVNAATTSGTGDNVTFHHDTGRTGWYSAETALTTTNVASSSFKLLGTFAAPSGMPAFGKVYAQPLYVQNEKTSDGKTHNLVVIATMTDQIYAFDETTGAVVWEHNFTNAGAGVTQQAWTDTGCGDVNPDVGIAGTPVIDRTLDRIFVVVPTKESGVFHMRLHALSMASGADAVSAVEVTATSTLASGGTATTSAENNFNRGALLEANGNIYVPLGSHCDYKTTSTHGWVLAYSASSLATTGTSLDLTNSNTGGNFYLGSVWMSGFGPAADSSGNVYFATGNGPNDAKNDLSMSAIRVPGTLDTSKASTFTPYGFSADSNADADFGSGGVILLPNVTGTYPHLMFSGGKCGSGGSAGTVGCQKYLLNRDSLGGIASGDAGALWHADTGGGMWGGATTFQDAKGVTYLVFGTGSPISTYTLGLSPVSLAVQSSANPGCLECRNKGSQPIVSSNGTLAGTAVVWALKTPGNGGGNITLYAFDALNMSHTLFTGVAGPWTVGSGASYIGGALVSPTVANGRVYVPTDGGVAVFGLGQ